MKLGGLVLFGAMVLHAQTPMFEIHGTVSEPGLGGIAGAQVYADSGNAPTSLSIYSDGRGEFVLRTATPGSFMLRVVREGYAQIPVATSVARLDADHPRADVQLSMIRPGRITGRVVEFETLRPMEDVEVFAVRRGIDNRGVSAWNPAVRVVQFLVTAENREALVRQEGEERKTKSDGAFTITGLSPGEYAITLAPHSPTRWSTEYSADDLKIVDQESEVLFWPSGTPPDSAQPVSIGSGAVLSIGDIPLKKATRFRAHVSLAQGDCPVGESMRLHLFGKGELEKAPDVFPCGSELLLRGLEPGSYYLYAVSDWQGERDGMENAVWANAQFEISDKNVEVTLAPQHGVIVEGQLVAAEGIASLPERINIGVQPEEVLPGMRPGGEQFIDWTGDGKFRMAVSPRTQSLVVNHSELYVKEIRYNGTPLRGSTLPIGAGGAAHKLEIILDDKFGSLAGTVMDGNRPAADARVLIAPESARVEELQAVQAFFRNAGSDGALAAVRLAPGEYRVVAVAAAQQARAHEPGVLERLLSTAQRVTLAPGGTQTVTVRLSEIR